MGRGVGRPTTVQRLEAVLVALLDGYQDPKLQVDASLTPEQVTEQEVERLQAACAVLGACAAVPRRLADGGREELALDKKRARRALHVERQCLVIWGGAERPATDDEKVAGAQLSWDAWREECQRVIQARLRYIATWAKKTSNLRYGKSAVVRLAQELDWLDYALRD